MAVRTPLFWDTASDSIKEMTAAQITQIVKRATYWYGQNPSVLLNIVSSGGNFATFQDTRLIAGQPTSNPTAPLPPLLTQGVQVTTDTYELIDAATSAPSVTPIADVNNITFPVYFDGNDLVAMTQQDFFDTFIYPAIDLLVAEGTSTNTTAGTYTVSTSTSLTNHTQLGLIYTDTVTDIAAYTADGMPEALDQINSSLTVNYYLHRRNNNSPFAITQPLVIDASSNLQVYQLSSFDTILSTAIRYTAVNDANGYAIEYSMLNGNPRGTGIVNRIYDDEEYEGRRFGENDYRSQYHPAGSIVTSDPVYLRIRKV